MDNINELIDLENSWTLMGLYFGFPVCCINEFCTKDYPDKKRSKAGNCSGFIPCSAHAEQILKKEIKLEDLIGKRYCPINFPEDDIDTDKKYLETLKFMKNELEKALREQSEQP